MIRSLRYVRGIGKCEESFFGAIRGSEVGLMGAELNYKRESSETEGHSSGVEPRGEKGGG